jgi:hypothetical protein
MNRLLFNLFSLLTLTATLALADNIERGDINNDRKIDLLDTILSLQVGSTALPRAVPAQPWSRP